MKLEMVSVMKLRKSVQWFARQMEAKLREKDYRNGWRSCHQSWLCKRITDERNELKRRLADGSSPEEIIKEAADVANFAMMIADNARNTK